MSNAETCTVTMHDPTTYDAREVVVGIVRRQGAHGQPGALVIGLAPDGTVAFHDKARMVYGTVTVPGTFEPVKVETMGEAELAVRNAYLQPRFDHARGCTVRGYNGGGWGQYLR